MQASDEETEHVLMLIGWNNYVVYCCIWKCFIRGIALIMNFQFINLIGYNPTAMRSEIYVI